MMKLLKFRVTNFRSVQDSGWIETDNVTALIGTNESGKTNLLIPLWKLRPANDGEINALADYPRSLYGQFKGMEKKPVFIEAFFELSDDLAGQVATIADATIDEVRIVSVKRDFAGSYWISFPDAPSVIRHIPKSDIAHLLSEVHATISQEDVEPTDETFKNEVLDTLATVKSFVHSLEQTELDERVINQIQLKFSAFDNKEEGDAPQPRTIANHLTRLTEALNTMLKRINKAHPNQVKEARQFVVNNLPYFVYYSNYGNLDSEIYLPHVIDNMKRSDLGQHEQAKARTLKVLFDFVKLKPQEILELGFDFDPRTGQNPNQDQIKEVAEKKKEREILLNSASSDLTKSFRSWWKQGDYRFDFSADGNFFRIWVSDDKRPEPIELEGRSTGLQWFLSFYLVFLVESTDTHKDAILLLDEPGLSLHPIAQEDLSNFFESLAHTNQLIYTTHSPFMVDPDHLDRVKAVYIDTNGNTVVSDNLRASERNPAQSRSIYPVHAALGLSISTMLLQGCEPILVEGTADQLYLSCIKNYLISKGHITPKRELLFVPAGGVKGITAVAPILTAKGEELPYAIMDSDRSGRDTANKLKTSLYQKDIDRIIMIGDVRSLADAEVEDLIPHSFIVSIITRYLSRPDIDEFSDEVEENSPIIPQIEAYARKYDIQLEDGWKVELAKRVKARMLKTASFSYDDEMLKVWQALFTKITSDVPSLATSSRKT